MVGKKLKKTIDNLHLLIPSSVYDPAEDSFLLAENVHLKKGEKVLEVGSGSGYVSLYLAAKYSQVEFFCIDTNFAAAHITKKNAQKNKLDIESICGNMFEPFHSFWNSRPFFDVVLFNSPYLPVNEEGKLAQAWSGGKDGLEVVERFLVALSKIMKNSGRAYLVVSSYTDIKQLEVIATRSKLMMKELDRIKVGGEAIILYEISV